MGGRGVERHPAHSYGAVRKHFPHCAINVCRASRITENGAKTALHRSTRKGMEDREWTDAGARILGRQTYHFAKKGYLAGRASECEWSGTGVGAGST